MKGVKTVENGTKNPCFLTKISFFREISVCIFCHLCIGNQKYSRENIFLAF